MDGKSINRRKKTNRQKLRDKNEKLTINNDELKVKSKKLSNTNKKSTTINNDFDKNKLLIYTVLLIVITFGVFSPTFKNGLTNWDDGKYIPENPFIEPFNFETTKEIFFSKDKGKLFWMGNYHPLTMLSLNINYAFAKKDAEGNVKVTGFQFINILLHVLNTLLVFLIIKALLKNLNIAFFAALLFGIHTLHVESVAWIAERKDVLYTFFFLAGLLSYIKYTDNLKIGRYILTFLLFFLSLLSKGQAVSLAVTIILIDYFKNIELLSLRVIIEKIPFFALALVFGFIAVTAQKEGNALQVINTTPLLNRIGIAGFGYTMYLLKLIFPIGLSAIYPYPDIIHQTIPAYFWLGLITVIATGIIALKAYKNNKIIFLGIGFFAVNIFLLLQLLPVGSAIYADRYAYIPSIGFYLIVAYFLSKIKNVNNQFIVLGIYAFALSFLTVDRIGDWKDSRTLWEDVVKKQPKSVVAWNNLGSEYNRHAKDYLEQGDIASFEEYTYKAINCFNTAIDQKPDYKSAFYNRGFAKFNLAENNNDTTTMIAALEDFNRTISIDIEFHEAYLQRGILYTWLNEYEKALIDYNYGLSLRPNNTRLIINRATTKGRLGDYEGAIADLNLAISINPNQAEAYSNRGLAYAYMGEYDLALDDYNKAISFEEDGQTYFNRGLTYYNLNDFEKALSDFEKAIQLYFEIGDLYFYKAFCERKLNNPNVACEDMQKSVNLGFPPAINYVSTFCNQ